MCQEKGPLRRHLLYIICTKMRSSGTKCKQYMRVLTEKEVSFIFPAPGSQHPCVLPFQMR